MRRSLAVRLIALSLAWVIIALTGTGMIIARFYRHHIEDHYDAHVRTHVEELVAAAGTADGQFVLSGEPTDPRFYRPGSGWYWEVRQVDSVLASSASLGKQRLDLSHASLDEGMHGQLIPGPVGEPLRAQVAHVAFPAELGSLTVVATAPALSVADDVGDFGFHVAASLTVLGIGIAAAVALQVVVALRPLQALRQDITVVRDGGAARLPDHYPGDVQPLVDELNHLIGHNAVLLKRARTQLADLAHAVKNPLSVIRNAARKLHQPEGQLILDQSHVMAASIDHCLTRARMYGQRDAMGYRTNVASVLDDVCFAVDQLYRNRGITLNRSPNGDAQFGGEAQDLEEMVGNLLDNACKWARQRIDVIVRREGDRLHLTVEDDGPGIDPDQRQQVLERGRRLDESTPGDGQGLAIVRELADLYAGELRLGESDLGGLRAELLLPAA